MKYFVLLFVLSAVFEKNVLAKKRHKNHHHTKSHDSKIVGGDDASIEQFPYQAYILVMIADGEEGDAYECGGSILNPTYILSAAHCFEEHPVNSVTARIGSTDKFDGGHQYEGTYKWHEKYDSSTLDFDIGYFKSNTKMELDGITAKAVTLIGSGESVPSGSMIKVSGWGDTSDGGDDSETLRAVEVPTLSNEDCNSDRPGFVTDRQFCGGYKEGGKDHCEGDSGGPAVLVESNVQVGVVSGGVGCAKPNTPSVYVNITDPPIRSWILEHTGV